MSAITAVCTAGEWHAIDPSHDTTNILTTHCNHVVDGDAVCPLIAVSDLEDATSRPTGSDTVCDTCKQATNPYRIA